MPNLLIDPILTLKVHERTEQHTLPSVLALLSSGAAVEFPALQAHQQHPWHAFLVQLAALVLDGTGKQWIPHPDKLWRAGLLSLSKLDLAPWELVAEDLGRPAFMQPPVPEETLEGFKPPVRTPSEIDVLIAAKNFDLKIRRIATPRPEHWVYALVTKQTSEGVLGQGNYGIARMNGGISSRPCVAIVASPTWSSRFQRDVQLWREHRQAIAKEHGYRGSIGLVWLEPWNGTKKIARRDLHPYFIEICRRIRLVEVEGKLAARTTTSKGTRIDNEGHNGHTGDIWTPLYLKKGVPTSLSLDEGGFNFRRLQDLLFQWRQAPAMTPLGGDSWLYASAICRGQGKTLGYHERMVFLPAEVGRHLIEPHRREQLANRAQAWVEMVSTITHSLLKPTLLALLQGVQEGRVDLRDTRANPYLRNFEALVDDAFFPNLWASLDQEDPEALATWRSRLLDFAERIRCAAFAAFPIPKAQRDELLQAASFRFEAGKSKLLGATLSA